MPISGSRPASEPGGPDRLSASHVRSPAIRDVNHPSSRQAMIDGRALIVTAAVIERAGRFLLTRRQQGVHLEGLWEFPGGKCEPGESLPACLLREVREELAVDVRVGDEIFSTVHDYGERRVELHFFSCALLGEPSPQMGQQMRWASREELATLEFPPADGELIDRLTLG